MSKVPAHYELIPKIIQLKNELSPETKLIINGDILDSAQGEELVRTNPGIDGYMIGRGVFQNPYCFTAHKPTKEELLRLLNLHLDLFDLEDKRKPSFEPLKHYFKIYVKDFPGASELRQRLMDCHTTQEARQVLERNQTV